MIRLHWNGTQLIWIMLFELCECWQAELATISRFDFWLTEFTLPSFIPDSLFYDLTHKHLKWSCPVPTFSKLIFKSQLTKAGTSDFNRYCIQYLYILLGAFWDDPAEGNRDFKLGCNFKETMGRGCVKFYLYGDVLTCMCTRVNRGRAPPLSPVAVLNADMLSLKCSACA